MLKDLKFLETMKLPELIALQKEIEDRIKETAASELAELEKRVSEIRSILQDGSEHVPTTRSKPKAKYIDPESGKTWSGRGMTPVWLREYEEAGQKREDFAVSEG